jgi:hypothetical protein
MPKLNTYCALFLLGMLLAIFPSRSVAQSSPNFFVKNRNDGLPSNTVFDLYVVKSGLLYIAHGKGLSSFDGGVFKNYYNKSSPFAQVSNILETDNGDIFCKGFDNTVYRLMGDSLVQEIAFPTKIGFAPGTTWKNRIIALQFDSICLYHTLTKKCTKIPIENLPERPNLGIAIFAGYTFLNEGRSAIIWMDKQLKAYKETFYATPSGTFHFSNNETFLARNKMSNGIVSLRNKRLLAPGIDDHSKLNYLTILDSNIWLCCDDGIYLVSRQNSGAKHLLQGYSISDAVQTKDGTYIAGSLGDGLIIIPDFEEKRIAGGSSKIVQIAASGSNVLFADKAGNVSKYSISTDKKTPLLQLPLFTKTEFLFFDSVAKGLFASGSRTAIVQNGVVSQYPFALKDICYLQSGMLLASNAGLYYFCFPNRKNADWVAKHLIPKQSDKQVLRLDYFTEPVTDIAFESTSQTIYARTNNHLFAITKQGLKVLPNPSGSTIDLFEFDKQIYVLTKESGLLRYTNGRYEPAFTAGMPGDIFYKAVVGENFVYILGEKGLYRVNKYEWTKISGKSEIEAVDVESFTVAGNKVFSLIEGELIEIASGSNIAGAQSAQFLLQQIKSKNTGKTIARNTVLEHKDNSLLIEFSLLSFAHGKNTHLAYTLNNNAPVHLAVNARQIHLNYLNPDDYTLKFFIVSDNMLSPVAQLIQFSIRDPFYRQWWFYLMLLVLLTLLGFSITKTILRRWKKNAALIQSKLELEKELNKSALSSIKAQMNPHFIFNALNAIQSYVYMNDKKNASVYISKFSELTRVILDRSNEELISLEEEINTLRLYLDLECMRFEDQFDYRIEKDTGIDPMQIRIPSMLIQPYVENAIRHGLMHRKDNRRLRLQFGKLGDNLLIIIEDNGVGRSFSRSLNARRRKNHKSFAMDANQKRLEIMKHNFPNIRLEIQDKYDDSGLATGTEVVITLPLINE